MEKFDFAFNVPLNGLSFGNVSVAILREIHKLGYEPSIFPIGNQVDLSCQEEKEGSEFGSWLGKCLKKGLESHKRERPVFKLWHLSGALESFSEKQILYTFYELDSPTNEEINAVKNQSKVFVSNSFTKSVFDNFGVQNMEVLPLGFDSHNFKVVNKKYYHDDRIVFLLLGKFEKRKHHQKVIELWIKKFGNNPRYFLNCALYNHFLKPEHNQAIFNQLMGGKRYFNVHFLGFMQQNSLYNDFLNSGHVVIAMSAGEGFGLGEFHSVALGKHCVGLYAHGHKQWMNQENSVLVQPCGKIEAYDGMFFHKGQPFNQGNIFDFNGDEFIAGCEQVIKRHEQTPVNTEGLKLQDSFTYERLAIYYFPYAIYYPKNCYS